MLQNNGIGLFIDCIALRNEKNERNEIRHQAKIRLIQSLMRACCASLSTGTTE